MEKSRVKLNICGLEYVLTSEDSESYMRSVGDKVEEKLRWILEKNPKLSLSMASVLASLEFCDENFKCHEKIENLKTQVKDSLDENAKIRESCSLAEREIFKLRGEINELELQINKYKTEVEVLKTSKKVQNEYAVPKSDIVTFSLLENEIAENC